MPTIFYRCSKCRREHPTHDEAASCERTHQKIKSAKIKTYGIWPYPYEIEVTFHNGETRTYHAESMK